MLTIPTALHEQCSSPDKFSDCEAVLLLQGLCKSIGVSNFGVPHLKKLGSTAVIWPPAANQIEVHPWLQRREVVSYCQDSDIVVEVSQECWWGYRSCWHQQRRVLEVHCSTCSTRDLLSCGTTASGSCWLV